jgi:hypothetical protein
MKISPEKTANEEEEEEERRRRRRRRKTQSSAFLGFYTQKHEARSR